MQPSGRVHDDHVSPAGLGRLDRIVRDCGGVSASLRADEVSLCSLRPDLELLLGSGPERVGGREDDLEACLVQAARQLSDRRRLPGPVHAHHENHGRCAVELEPRFAGRRHELDDHLLERCQQLRLRPGLAGFEAPHDLDRRRDSTVGREQCLLDALPGLVVARIEDGGSDLAGQRLAAGREGIAESGEPAPRALVQLGFAILAAQELGPRAAHALSACAASGASRLETICETPSAPIVTP